MSSYSVRNPHIHIHRREGEVKFLVEEKSINRAVKNEEASQKILFLLFIPQTVVLFFQMIKLHFEQF